MSNSNNQASTRHHYVQRAYLDKFTEKGKIDVINREDGGIRKGQRTAAIANERGLYTYKDDEGKKDGSLEGAFAIELEGPAIALINRITSVFPYVPRRRERSLMADYLAFQYLRTPESKRKFQTDAGRFAAINLFNMVNDDDEIVKILTKEKIDVNDDNIKKYRDETIKSLIDNEIVPDGNTWLNYIVEGMGHIAPILHNRFNWHLFYFDKPTLITSDHPVVLRRIHSDDMGVGFANADEVMFPLAKNYLLLLTTDTWMPEQVHFKHDHKLAEICNYYVANSSYIEIYSPPSISHEHAEPLGKRAIIKMTGSIPKEVDFLSQYSGVLSKQRPYGG